MAKTTKKKTKALTKPRTTAKRGAKVLRMARKPAVKAAKKTAPRKAATAAVATRKRRDSFKLNGVFLSLPSCKVGLMLSLCGAKFDYHHVNLQGGEQRTPEFLAKNRFGQVPVLEHNGRALCQSNAILTHLAEHFGKFQGRTAEERQRIAEWLAWDLDRMASGVGLTRGLTRFLAGDPATVEFTRKRGEQALDLLERHLAGSPFLVGARPTIADIAVYVWVATCDEGGFDLSGRPKVRDWAARMKALPGGGHPYDVMPREDKAAA
jgi:glutathione S-transferase